MYICGFMISFYINVSVIVYFMNTQLSVVAKKHKRWLFAIKKGYYPEFSKIWVY